MQKIHNFSTKEEKGQTNLFVCTLPWLFLNSVLKGDIIS